MARRAIGLTATVRVRGPDPRGDIAADAAFFDHRPSSSNDDDDGLRLHRWGARRGDIGHRAEAPEARIETTGG